ncbi:MAG: hypothetical protein E7049_06865 [Lentisphaerae bacterium]|jgi:hypothetical protein|nr:hypothetical protein [Lentisphaerota bacterium]
MKKLMFAISLAGLLGLGASAAVQSANTFGVLKVESSTKQTIICVPWVAVGAGESPVAVEDLVMTSNLEEGDGLYLYDPSTKKYKAWFLTSSGTWDSPIMVDSVGATTGKSAGDTTAERGNALILVRQHPTTEGETPTAKPIYLYGQYTNSSVPAMTLSKGAWNLIAPPNMFSSVSDLNSNYTWENVDDSDTIRLQNNGIAITLVRHENQWAYKSGNNYITAAAKVQPGQGFWYVSKGTTDPRVTFSSTTNN